MYYTYIYTYVQLCLDFAHTNCTSIIHWFNALRFLFFFVIGVLCAWFLSRLFTIQCQLCIAFLLLKTELELKKTQRYATGLDLHYTAASICMYCRLLPLDLEARSRHRVLSLVISQQIVVKLMYCVSQVHQVYEAANLNNNHY